MDMKELIDLVALGEGYTLEFKRSMSNSLGEEICAFANAEGGKIVLGVEDNGSISGFTLNNSDSSRIQSIARNMDPSFQVDIEVVNNLVVIHVPEGTQKPYSISGRFYVRIGASSQRLSRDEIRDFFRKEGLVLFDNKPHVDFDLENDFDEQKFIKFLELANITNNQDKNVILNNLGLMDSDFLVNAGVLLFCHRISKFFLQGKVICVLFEGTSRVNIIDKKEFDADLISNYENAYSFIVSKLNTKFKIGKERVEELELPKAAIREALMNAFVHRDYFSPGHIQINVFIDKVEINSPGGLVSGLYPEDFGTRSLSRNPLLFDLLSRTKHVESAGTGINRIVESMSQFNLGAEFIYQGLESFTTILSREKVQKHTRKFGIEKFKISKEELKDKKLPKQILIDYLGEGWEKVGSNLGVTPLKIRIVMGTDNTVTIAELASQLDFSTTTIENNIKKLKDAHIIKRVGSDKEGSWKILK